LTHILKNKNLEIHIDLPLENYQFSRFDWTGKIVKVKFKNKCLTGIERLDSEDNKTSGQGLFNEFGIDTALGYEAAKTGDWFHKIGVGLLKKNDDTPYFFIKAYEINPSEFKIATKSNKILINCKSHDHNGYSYILKKEIELNDNSFAIKYFLKNTGDKPINTNEYNHNFLAIDKDLIGTHYILKFPFELRPELFTETVNPEQKVAIGLKDITFKSTPEEQFFFSNLTGGDMVNAGWELINLEHQIAISETGNFQTNKVNLWGWKHVISPELFFNISIETGQSIEWCRTYNVYQVK